MYMKKVIAALLVLSLITVQIFAQTSQTLISGRIMDDKKKPVEGATVSLMKATDSSLFQITVTEKAGKFSFQNIPFGNYYINASAVNHAKPNSKVFELNQ